MSRPDFRSPRRRVLRVGALLAASAAFACAGTRPTDLGLTQGALKPCPSSPNCVSSGAEDEGHKVAPLALRAPAAAAWAEARTAVLALPRTVIVSEREGYLHAESTSALMGYVDDLELALSASGDCIEVRSASRIGYGDGGVNRERVEALRRALVNAGVVAPVPG